MLRVGLWVAGVLAALLIAFVVFRSVNPTSEPVKGAPEPVVVQALPAEQAAEPAAAVAPEPPKPAPPPPPAEIDQQVQEDAAAVGMTTREPEGGSAADGNTSQ